MAQIITNNECLISSKKEASIELIRGRNGASFKEKKVVSNEGKRNRIAQVISAASLSHICSSGKQRGGESECVYVGI